MVSELACEALWRLLKGRMVGVQRSAEHYRGTTCCLHQSCTLLGESKLDAWGYCRTAPGVRLLHREPFGGFWEQTRLFHHLARLIQVAIFKDNQGLLSV